ncbi:OmpH family outer membrane protein [uncultured Alistipes sp.]|uniref:OmpH family outer membrane protein n=1 Tax=uncultured Alistipes sp. TaxID=538949 RepID=UPI0026197659|nr:OmpH family outer membrane protein [uncultured Alistipes sp.]
MKKIFYVLAVAALFFAGCKGSGDAAPAAVGETPAVESQSVVSGDIVYVQVEAVLAQSDLFKTEGATLQEKTKKAQESWAKKEQNLQAKAAQLQEKYQKGLITTANAQAEQEKIQQQIANYQSAAQKEAQTLDEENFVFTNRAQDLIHRAVQEINADKKYKFILNATALVDADTLLDITPAVLAKVNELYAADKAAEK